MSDPTNAELLEFVARFAGWTDFTENCLYGNFQFSGSLRLQLAKVPDYLHSVDAWLRDVWPKVKEKELAHRWHTNLCFVVQCCSEEPMPLINADARSRCLALYRALDGKLPDQPQEPL